MDRIGPAGGSPTVMLTNGQMGWVDENLSTGQEGTEIVAAFMNGVQEELMSILTAGSVTPNIATFNQVLTALQTLFGGAATVNLSGGTAISGFLKLGGGWLLQFGTASFPASGANSSGVTITFPTTFPTRCFGVVGTNKGCASTIYGSYPTIACTASTVSGATFEADTLSNGSTPQTPFNQTVPFFYIALGN